jgi:hypothetical protein
MSEKEEFEKFASKALRLNRRGSFEQMLANHLVLAVNAEILHKIRLTLEAAYMMDFEKVKVDKNQLDRLYSLTLSFLGTNYKTDFISIVWNFTETEENFNKYVKAWLQPIPLSFSHDTEFMRQQKQKQLDESSILKGLFLKWALPQVMTIFEKLSKQVDPSIYQDVLAGIKGEKTKRENHMG